MSKIGAFRRIIGKSGTINRFGLFIFFPVGYNKLNGNTEEIIMRLPETSVRFSCGDSRLEGLVRAAAECVKGNVRLFGSRPVLVEGAGYEKIWLETQPMGGEDAFFYCPEASLNDTLLFMENQREDGRLPGSVACTANGAVPQFDKLQGFCFPEPACRRAHRT